MDQNGTILNLRIRRARNERPLIFILSGAGLSAQSGIPTYRDAGNNWLRADPVHHDDLEERPASVFENINRRIKAYGEARPNAAHLAIAKFKRDWRAAADIVHVTQNIDTLCEEAGDAGVFHMHGSFLTSRCSKCNAVFPRIGFYREGAVCPSCKAGGWNVRPNIVFFGEIPYGMDWMENVVKKADVFLAVGTSGTVYPAAGLVLTALKGHCPDRILLTKDLPDTSERLMTSADGWTGDFTRIIRGDAVALLPRILQNLASWLEACTAGDMPDEKASV